MSSPIYIHSTSMGQADYAKLRVLKLCENADHDLGRTCIMRMYIMSKLINCNYNDTHNMSQYCLKQQPYFSTARLTACII